MSFKGYLVRELDPEHKLKRLLEGGGKVSFTQLRKMQAPSDRLPRLSSALRAYGGVSDPSSRLEPVALEERRLRRKQRKKGDELASEKTWTQVTAEVVAGCSKQDEVKVSFCCCPSRHLVRPAAGCLHTVPLQVLGELRLIQQESRELGKFKEFLIPVERMSKFNVKMSRLMFVHTSMHTVGGDFSKSTVDSAAIFLFDLFTAEPLMTRSHAEEIKRVFGPYPASTVNRICKAVERILTYLPSGWGNPLGKAGADKSTKKRKEFGHNIQFKYSDGFLDPSSSKAADLPGYDSLSDSDEVPVKSKIVNFMAGSFQTSSAAVSGESNKAEATTVAVQSSHGSPQRSDWLVEQCKECARDGEFAGELTWKDLYQAVFEQLSSGRDNTVIQNDVRFVQLNIKQIMAFGIFYIFLCEFSFLSFSSAG